LESAGNADAESGQSPNRQSIYKIKRAEKKSVLEKHVILLVIYFFLLLLFQILNKNNNELNELKIIKKKMTKPNEK
jgi:hypothetical protein